MISGQKIVQSFSRGKQTQSEFDAINERLKHASLRATFWSSLTNPVTRFVNSIVYAVVALTGALTAILNPAFTVGMLTRMLAYANQYTKPFNEISGVITELQGAIAAAERIFEIIDTKPETPEAKKLLLNVCGNIKLDNICFSYSNEKKLIENLCLDVRPGMKVAIVGPTGAETTLIITDAFYDTDSGAYIDNENTDVTSTHCAGCYGMVFRNRLKPEDP